jgi:hypothetical protein
MRLPLPATVVVVLLSLTVGCGGESQRENVVLQARVKQLLDEVAALRADNQMLRDGPVSHLDADAPKLDAPASHLYAEASKLDDSSGAVLPALQEIVTRFPDSPEAVLASKRMSEIRSEVKRLRQPQQEESERAKTSSGRAAQQLTRAATSSGAGIQRFRTILRTADPNGDVVISARVSERNPSEAIVTVSGTWHNYPAGEQLETAKTLWMGWVNALQPSDADAAYIKVQTEAGTVLAKSGIFGSSVKLVD